MTENHVIEIEIDARRFDALQAEASRLGLELPQLMVRAASAWLCDITESAVTTSASATVVAS